MRKLVSVLVLLSFILIATFTFATAQAGDVLILGGKKYGIYTNPLAPWVQANPGRIPKSNVVSSGLWRGYIATFEIGDNHLYLTDIKILKDDMKAHDDMRSVMNEVFPGQKQVLADWFTGNIIIPNGKQVQYVHMGYASIYEKYIVLRVESGMVKQNSQLDTKAFLNFRDAQFARFKQTEQYKTALEETKEESQKDGTFDAKMSEEFLREFYSAEYMSMIFPDTAQTP